MKIAVSHTGYPITRNIINKISEADYVVLKHNNNLFHTLSTLKNLIFRKKNNFEGKYFFYGRKDVDILHLYNDINYSGRTWVASFETLMPRFDETKNDHQKTEPSHKINAKTRKGIAQICKKNCLGVIAISQASANINLELVKNYPHLEGDFKRKLHVIHPSQKIISEKIDKNTAKLNFIFVGTQFHLKGGVEMYEVFKKLREKYEFTVTVVSSFKTDHYVTRVSETEAQKTKEILKKEDWIILYENIPNEKVLELIQNSNVGILPTWSDTYGFSVLEMQACGVPVITTDIRALPEINNNNCGWLIRLPQNRLKQGLYFTDEQKENLRLTLKAQLEKILIGIFENKGQIKTKAEKSLERIKKYHDPKEFENKLSEIYRISK